MPAPDERDIARRRPGAGHRRRHAARVLGGRRAGRSTCSSTTSSRSTASCRRARRCTIYGIVGQVRARHEGARFDSDVFLIADGRAAGRGDARRRMVQVTRVVPEIVRAAAAGQPRCAGPSAPSATRRSTSTDGRAPAAGRAHPRRRAGLPRPRLPRRHEGRARQHLGHLAASPRRPATPRSCSTRCSTPACSARRRPTPRRSIFNVKGEDLLFLDHANTTLDDDAARSGTRRSACTPAPFRRRRRPRPAAHGRPERDAGRRRRARPVCARSSGPSPSSASRGCCRSCSPTPRTSASSTRSSCSP